jgi:hypothetical protein
MNLSVKSCGQFLRLTHMTLNLQHKLRKLTMNMTVVEIII